MTKGRGALLVVAAMVFLTVGFVIGQIVQAAGTIPGSADDPLVAKSYVEEAVGKQVVGLQTTIDELQAKVDLLQEKVDSLSGKSSSSSSTQKPPSGSTNKPDSSTTKPPRQGNMITVTGSSANIRTGPGTGYDKITTLSEGDTALFLLEENSWCKIQLADGQEGWVANWLVEVK
ncbi:MAG: SH3 domain-containing protein [Desulfitobacteriaceae bacterium]|nr:SH3 domain-containing protein [Desulfitobacteriaceae bacterium]